MRDSSPLLRAAGELPPFPLLLVPVPADAKGALGGSRGASNSSRICREEPVKE